MQRSIIATRETIFKRSKLDRLSPWPTINRRRIFFFKSSFPKKYPTNNGSVVPSLVPKYFDFRISIVSEFDNERSTSTLLRLCEIFPPSKIILNVPGCDVNYTKAFPRIYDAE